MRRSIVAANWKLNGSLDMANSLVSAINSHSATLEGVDAVICPPFPYLAAVAELISANNVYLGAQSVAQQQNGAFTGEVGAEMVVQKWVVDSLLSDTQSGANIMVRQMPLSPPSS